MKDRTLLLAGLVDEDDFEKTRQIAVESYREQLDDDRKVISEQVNFVEEDEERLNRLIGEEEAEPEWIGSKNLNENIAMGGYGPGFAGQNGYGLGFGGGGGVSSRYTPSQEEIFGSIVGQDYHKKSEWGDSNAVAKVDMFKKISDMGQHAFTADQSALSEMELPEFDENFNPILREGEKQPSLFNFDSTNDSRNELQEILDSGEFAAEGGIGPGFSAFDGPKEIKNPYDVSAVIDKWYIAEGSMDDLEMSEERDDSDFLKVLTNDALDALHQNGKKMEIYALRHELALMGNGSVLNKVIKKLEEYGFFIEVTEDSDGGELPWIMHKSLGHDSLEGLGEGEVIKSLVKTKDNLSKARKVLDKTEERSKEKQSDLEEGDMVDLDMDLMGSTSQPPGMGTEIPEMINLATTNLKLVGTQDGQHVYSVGNEESAMLGLSEDLDGWYAQLRDPVIGLAGEGWGDSVEAAAEDALQSYTGDQQEMPSALQESLEGRTSGDIWSHRRTGAPTDGFQVRFREENPTMHPELPEEPSSEGHPGLPGWDFYDGDHTYQKMQAKKDDMFDEKEIESDDAAVARFFKENSTFDLEGDDEVLEESEFVVHEQDLGMGKTFSIEND